MTYQVIRYGLALLTAATMLPGLVNAQIIDDASQVAEQSHITPYFRKTFGGNSFDGSGTIWTSTKDKLGRRYVGTEKGLFVKYDEGWHHVSTPTSTPVRSLDFGYNNRVYWGDKNDLGYIDITSNGEMKTVSLVENLLTDSIPDIGNIWMIHATDNGVYFQSSNHVIRYTEQKIDIVNVLNGIHTSFVIDGVLYGRVKNYGLAELIVDKWHLINGGEYFATMRVFVFLKHPEGGYFVGTRDNGFYHLKNGNAERIRVEYEDVISKYWIYGAVGLDDETFALNTLGGGVIISDYYGHTRVHISGKRFLVDDHVVHIDWDGRFISIGTRSGGLEIISPPDEAYRLVSGGNERGIEGRVNRLSNPAKLLVAASSGAFVQQDEYSKYKSIYNDFTQVPEVVSAYDIIEWNGYIVATDGGIVYYSPRNNTTRWIYSGDISYDIDILSSNGKEYLISAGRNGTSIFDMSDFYDNENAQLIPTYLSGREVRQVEYDAGREVVWLSEYGIGLYKIPVKYVLEASRDVVINSNMEFKYSESAGLYSFQISNGHALVSDTKNIYTYDNDKSLFTTVEVEQLNGNGEIESYTTTASGILYTVHAGYIQATCLVDQCESVSLGHQVYYRVDSRKSDIALFSDDGLLIYNEISDIVVINTRKLRDNTIKARLLVDRVTTSTDGKVVFGGT